MGVNDYTKNSQYMEGQWQARYIISDPSKTTYETLEGAIIAKAEVVRAFEEEFGFTKDMENPDSNYMFNLGILHALEKALKDGS